MSRSIDPILADALANQSGETILRVVTWVDQDAYNAAPTVPEHTWEVLGYDLFSTSSKVELVTENDYTVSDFTVYIIERGVEVSGVEYVIQSGLFFVKTYREDFGRIYLTGSSYPNQRISIAAGDGTYGEVIAAFCAAIGKTAVFKYVSDAFQDYQFLPAGKSLSLNKAELFENLLKQKFTILVYEESPNNLVFYTQDSYEKNTLSSIVWSPELGLFCAVSRNGYAFTSPDGDGWTVRTAAEANTWRSIVWSPELGLFCAVSDGGTHRVMTSPDGTTWTVRTAAEANTWCSIAWSPELGLFCAVSQNGTYHVMTSPDGITWTARTAAEANLFNSVVWSPELGLFCAVSDGGTHRVMTSPDGTTWTARTEAEANSWRAITWSSELGLFCAVAINGTHRVMTSPDGTTWTARTAAEANRWGAIAWSSELGLFCAGADDGVNRFMVSLDTIAWHPATDTADHIFTYVDGPTSSIIRSQSEVHYLWRDETGSLNTSGDITKPQWNLGYLDSLSSPPSILQDPYYKIFLQKAPVRLDVTDGDKVHFTPYWSIDPTKTIDAMMQVSEHLHLNKEPSWYQEIRSIVLFDKTEGGALPSTIERVAAYTPLVSTGFDGNLTPSVNNLQALAEAVDDLVIPADGTDVSLDTTNFDGNLSSADNTVQKAMETIDDMTVGDGYTPPTTTAASDVQVGDGAGAWIKKTLAEFVTILRTVLDAIYAPYGGWQLFTPTITRTGNHTFTVAGDYTSTFRPGRKIKYNDGAVDYGVVDQSSYSSPNTTVTLMVNTDYVMAATTITNVYVNTYEMPDGFPLAFNFTPDFGGFTLGTGGTLVAKFTCNGGVVTETVGFVLGTSPTVSNLTYTARGHYVALTAGILGIASCNLASVTNGIVPGQMRQVGSSNQIRWVCLAHASGTYPNQSQVGSSVPGSWAAGDVGSAFLSYMIN